MKIKTRLTIYNVTIIFISLIIMTFMMGAIINIFQGSYYEIDNLVIDGNVGYVEKMVNDVDHIQDITSQEKIEQLKEYGYEVFVFNHGVLTFGQNKLLTSGVLTVVSNYKNEDGIKTIFVDNATMVTKMFEKDLLIVMNDNLGSKLEGSSQTNFQVFISRFLLLSISMTILILCIASLLSRKFVLRLMKPVELLTLGAKRIQNGNFEEPIVYYNQDEFQFVIRNFNEMQRHLKEETKKNKAFEKAKSEMIHGLSHDVRTPLTSVKGYIKGIQDGVANTPEKQAQYLSIAYKKTIDIEMLLNKLFDTYQIETIEINKVKTKMQDFLDFYQEVHQEEFLDKGIEVLFHYPEAPLYIEIDQEQMARVFNNLFGNAMKYSDVDPLIIEISVWQEENNVHISFKDNGVGVKEEHLAFLFDEFWREDGSRTSKNEGNGLGLYIIKNIIESHKGEISVKNQNGLLIEMILPGGWSNE